MASAQKGSTSAHLNTHPIGLQCTLTSVQSSPWCRNLLIPLPPVRFTCIIESTIFYSWLVRRNTQNHSKSSLSVRATLTWVSVSNSSLHFRGIFIAVGTVFGTSSLLTAIVFGSLVSEGMAVLSNHSSRLTFAFILPIASCNLRLSEDGCPRP